MTTNITADCVFCGCGPACMATLVYLEQVGALESILQTTTPTTDHSLVIIDPAKKQDFGVGALGQYISPSNTSACMFALNVFRPRTVKAPEAPEVVVDAQQLEVALGEAMESKTRLSTTKTTTKTTTPIKDDFIYFEIDGVSEIVDTLRGCGLTSASDRLVCEGSLSLLRTQNEDGSWPYWTSSGDGKKDPTSTSYDILHPTWVAVQGLRDRDFKLDRPASEKWRIWITKIVKQVGFADEPTYDSAWLKKKKKKKTTIATRAKSKINSGRKKNLKNKKNCPALAVQKKKRKENIMKMKD